MKRVRKVAIALGVICIVSFWTSMAINHDLLAANSLVHSFLYVGSTSLVVAFVAWRIEVRLANQRRS